MSFDPVSSLDREWPQLATSVLPARLRTWADRDPSLAPFAEPIRLIQFLRGPAPWATKDELLHPLVRIARDDPLAARVVLQALMPGLKRIAARVLLDLSERDELWELLLAHAWERIRRYPLERRPRRIAANVLFDTLRRTMRELERERRRRHRSASHIGATPPNDDQRADMAEILLNAVSVRAISQSEARILFEVRVERCSLAEVAAAEHLSYNVLRVRLQRAERRLLIYLGDPPVPKRRSDGPFFSEPKLAAKRMSRIDKRPRQEG